jgi:hypothetical protein
MYFNVFQCISMYFKLLIINWLQNYTEVLSLILTFKLPWQQEQYPVMQTDPQEIYNIL